MFVCFGTHNIKTFTAQIGVMIMSKNLFFKSVMIFIALLFIGISGFQFYQHRHYKLPIVAGEGVTKVVKLSKYCANLKGTIADTNVFFMEGRQEGGTTLIIANTHANEPAALLSALVIIENAAVNQGALIVIPEFNNSGGRNTKPGDGYPMFYNIKTTWGSKKFRMGNRNASPLDQWPDPDVYIHYPDRQQLSFLDARNTNRTWPGRPNGPLMERVTYATMQLIKQEGVDVAIDMHGAETMYSVTNCIVAPRRCRVAKGDANKLASKASLYVKALEKFESHVEPSPENFRGLSHREIGDYSSALPFLLEAPIPFLDQPTGPKTEALLLDGKDPFLLKLSKKGKLFVPYDKTGWPMRKRVGQHCSVILELLKQYSRQYKDNKIKISMIPKYADVVKNGVGFYYQDPKTVDKDKIYTN